MNDGLLNSMVGRNRPTQAVSSKRSQTERRGFYFYASFVVWLVCVAVLFGIIRLAVPKAFSQMQRQSYVTSIGPRDPAWSFIEISDLHAGSSVLHAGFSNAVNYIISQKAAWNIKLVISAGDLYEQVSNSFYQTNMTGDALSTQTMTNLLYSLKSAGIPVMAVQGNHDANCGDTYPTLLTLNTNYFWDNILGTNFYSGDPYYFTNRIAGSTKDFAMKLTNGSTKYLFVGIGWYANPNTNSINYPQYDNTNDVWAAYSNSVAWASNLCAAFPDHVVTIVSHYITDTNGQPNTKDSPADPDDPNQTHRYYINEGPGIVLWNSVMNCPNLALMLCGHVKAVPMVVSKLTAADGHPVQAVKFNTQSDGPVTGTTALTNGCVFMLYTIYGGNYFTVKTYNYGAGRFMTNGEYMVNGFTNDFNFTPHN